MRRAKPTRGCAQLGNQLGMHFAPDVRGHVMRHEQSRAFPDGFHNRRLLVQQVGRNRIQQPALSIPDHIAVDAAFGGRRRQPIARQNPTQIVVHDHPTAGRGVVLVIFHAQSLGQIPLVMDDEQLATGAKHIGE